MPIYEYVCQSCAHRFEVRQSFKDPPISACERCGQAVTKVISPPAIMFKGSGWYVTDYSDKLKEPKAAEPAANGKEPAKTDAPAPAASSSPSTDGAAKSGGDAKPAAPAASTPAPAATPKPST